MAYGNPYRIPKPTTNIIRKDSFRPANEDGKFTGEGLARINTILTPTYLWVSEELSIPLQAVEKVELLNNDGAVGVFFLNALSRQVEVIHVCKLNLLGFPKRDYMRDFHDVLTRTIENLPHTNQDAGAASEEAIALGCERCGEEQAVLLDFGYFYCIGIWPICGAYSWNPTRRYLCRKHAVSTCLSSNIITSMFGYLGFPGILIAPYRVYKNVRVLADAYEITPVLWVVAVLCGTLVPVCLAAFLFA